MNPKKLLVLVLAVVTSVACKGEASLHNSSGKPTLSVSQGGLTCGTPQVDPTSPNDPPVLRCTLDFGGVPIGQSVTENVDIGNDGASSYQISVSGLTDPQFAVEPHNYPIEVVSAFSLAVSFKPFSAVPQADTLIISTTSQTLGKVVITLLGSGITLGVRVNPTSIDFGRVIVHTTASRPLTVTNLSTGPITLSPIAPQGNSEALFSVAILKTDFIPSYSYATPVPPGGTVTFQVSFSPLQQSSADENAYLVVAYATDKFVTVGLRGLGVRSGLCVSTGPLSVTPPSISFGHIPLNNSVTDFIYVEDCSNETLEIFASYLELSDGEIFTVAQPGGPGCPAPLDCQQVKSPDGPFTLHPGDKLTYPITFSPLQGEGYVGAFVVQDNYGDNVVVPINGGGGGPAISCQTMPLSDSLALDFGEVAVGISTTLSVVCTNTGNDITLGGKIDPSGELQVLESQLLITQSGSPFTAQVMVDGLSTQEVSLRAGQQFQVQVTFDPSVQGSDSAILYIRNNSQLTPSVAVRLQGQALELTDCNLAISPTALNFEQIGAGQTVQLPVTLTNPGNNVCLIDGLALSPSTDPAFTLLTNSPTSIELCGAAEPVSDKCSSATGSSYQVLVQFKPGVAGNYQGLLDFVVSSHSAPSQIVPLSGNASDDCLDVSPQELDFGNVGIKSGTTYCASGSRQIRALNVCGYPLEVTGLTNSAQSADFRITSAPQLPQLLQSGQLLEFDEEFVPGTAGAKYGSASIVAQSAGGGGASTYLAAFHGTASDTRQQVDTYVIPSPKVDILWVVDFQNMDGMSTVMGFNPNLPGSTGLAQSLSSFFGALSTVDYQLAVISSVDCTQNFAPPGDFVAPAGGGLLGDLQMLPCSGCTDSSANNAQIITGADAHPATEMYDILSGMASSYWNPPNLFWFEGNCGVGNFPLLGGDAFQPAFDALNPRVLAGHNKGFLRDDAALVVIALNMEDDTSSNLTGNPLSFYSAFFQNLKGFNPLTPFIFNAISITPAEVASRQSSCPGNSNLFLNGVFSPDVNIPSLVQQTSGQLVDVCTSDWAPALASLGTTSAAKLTTFTLSGTPMNPASGIQVAIASGGAPAVMVPQYTVVGGAAIWTYDSATNTLSFADPANAPDAMDTLTITYTNICY